MKTLMPTAPRNAERREFGGRARRKRDLSSDPALSQRHILELDRGAADVRHDGRDHLS